MLTVLIPKDRLEAFNDAFKEQRKIKVEDPRIPPELLKELERDDAYNQSDMLVTEDEVKSTAPEPDAWFKYDPMRRPRIEDTLSTTRRVVLVVLTDHKVDQKLDSLVLGDVKMDQKSDTLIFKLPEQDIDIAIYDAQNQHFWDVYPEAACTCIKQHPLYFASLLAAQRYLFSGAAMLISLCDWSCRTCRPCTMAESCPGTYL